MKRIRYSIALAFFAGWLTVLCAAENVSPWDLWRQGYTAFEKGESARDRGDHVKALEYFQEAAENYRAVRKARPSWNQNVINSRILLCEQEIADAKRLLNQPAAAASTGAVAAGTDADSTGSTTAVAGSDHNALAAELVKMQAEIAQYKKKLFDALVEVEDLRRQAIRGKSAAAEMENMIRERRVAEEKYRLLEAKCKELESKASRPSEELNTANRKLVEMRINLETAEQKLTLSRNREQTQIRENADLVRERNDLKSTLDLTKRRLEAVSQDAEALRTIRQQAAQEKNALLQKNTELEKQLAAAELRVKSRESDLATLDRRLQEAVKSRGVSAALSAEITAENEKLRKEAADHLKAVENAAAENRDLQNRLRETRQTLENLRSSLRLADERRAQAANEVKVMQQQVEKVTADRKLAEAENINLASRNRKLEQDIQRLSEQEIRLRKRLDVRDTADRAAVDALAVERTRLADQLAAQKLKLAEAKVDQENQQKRLDAVSKAAAELRAEYLKTKAQALSNEQELKKAAAVAEERNKLSKELDALQRNFAALQIEKRELTKYKQETSGQQQELERLRQLAARISNIERQNQHLSDRNAQLLRQTGAATAAADQLRRQRDEALAGTAKVQQERDAAESALVALRSREKENESLRANWNTRRAELEKRLAEMERTVREREIQNAEREKQNAQLQKQLIELRNKPVAAPVVAPAATAAPVDKAAAARTQQELARLTQQREQMEKAIKQEKERIAALRKNTENEAEKIRLKRIQAESEAEKIRLKRLQADAEAEKIRLKRQQEAIAAANLELRKQMDAAVAAAQSAAHSTAAVTPSGVAASKVQTTLPGAEKLTQKQITAMLNTAGNAMKEDSPRVARWNYRKVLESAPGNFEANFGMGKLELAQEEFAKAAIYLQQAHIARDKQPDVRLAYAQALLGQKKYGNALALLDGCSPEFRKTFDCIYARGLALAGAGQNAEARNTLLAAHKLRPKHGQVLLALAKLPVPRNNKEARMQAAKWYENAKKLGVTPDPKLEKEYAKLLNERTELIDFMSGAALEAEKHRDWNSAVWYYGQLRDLDPESGFHAERAARYCFLQKQYDKALQMLANRPPTPRGQWLKAAALLGKGSIAEAEKAAAQAAEINAPKPDADLLKVLQQIAKNNKNARTIQQLSGTAK